MCDKIWIVVTTLADSGTAEELAGAAVEKALAACAQVEPPITSHFVWKERVEACREIRIAFKVSAHKRDALVDWLKERHPYEVPEILFWPASSGDPAYRAWVEEA